MTDTATTTPYEQLRQRHLADAAPLLAPMLDRLTWSAERLAEHRTAELRRLLRVARDASPWHRERLAGIDLDGIDEAGIVVLPVMTKDDLMTHFDDIVTDDRLRLGAVEDHLAALTSDAYLFDRYHAIASGGSSGRRGVFVYDWDGWSTYFWSLQRHVIRAIQTDPAMAGAQMRWAFVGSAAPTHVSGAITQTFSSPRIEIHRFPVSMPTPEAVAGLNATQPTFLWGYASALHALAVEARAGRLRISTRWVGTTAEVLLPETRAALEEAFGVPVGNAYVSSEGGGVGSPCRSGPWPHLADDLVIVEPVDADGRPVPLETRCDKLHLTNLFNHALPLIRYEMTDQIEVLDFDEPCPCGCTHRRIADPCGRLDDIFAYGPVTVHPHVFRSALGRRREVVEYQVRQTPRGAAIAVRVSGTIDAVTLADEITGALARLGVPDAHVDVDVCDRLPRPSSGKLAATSRWPHDDRAVPGAAAYRRIRTGTADAREVALPGRRRACPPALPRPARRADLPGAQRLRRVRLLLQHRRADPPPRRHRPGDTLRSRAWMTRRPHETGSPS